MTLWSAQMSLSETIYLFWDLSLSCSSDMQGLTCPEGYKGQMASCVVCLCMWNQITNSYKVLGHQTKSLKPALGACSNIIEEITISIHLPLQQFVTSMSSSADMASLNRRLCSAPVDSVTMSESPSTQKWEISLCHMWNVKLEKLLGDEAAVYLYLQCFQMPYNQDGFPTIRILLQIGVSEYAKGLPKENMITFNLQYFIHLLDCFDIKNKTLNLLL